MLIENHIKIPFLNKLLYSNYKIPCASQNPVQPQTHHTSNVLIEKAFICLSWILLREAKEILC